LWSTPFRPNTENGKKILNFLNGLWWSYLMGSPGFLRGESCVRAAKVQDP
jgi:hypothetical protein